MRVRGLFPLLAAALLTGLSAASFAADTPVPVAGASSRIDAIRQRGTLRVAVLDEYPWLKQNPPGSAEPFQGPAWRLAREYAKRLGVRLETVPVDFDSKVAVLSSDQVDITIAPLLVTPARQNDVDLVVYSVSAQCLFGRADNPKLASVTRIDQLNRPDITVAYNVGSPQGAWILKRLPKAAHVGVTGNLANVPVAEIVAQKADVSTIDAFFFAGLQKKTPGLVSIPKGAACVASRELPIPIGMAVSKQQPAFIAWLRAVAREIKPQVDGEGARVERLGS